MGDPSASRRELEVQLIEKAWNDEAFKQTLLSNPKDALQEALGVQLPEGISVHVVEEDAQNLYLVLPQPPMESEELTEEELEAVAGGRSGGTAHGNPFCV